MTCKGCPEELSVTEKARRKYGLDPEELVGYAKNIGGILAKIEEGKSPDGFSKKVTVRSKPVNMLALYLEDTHKVYTKQGDEIGVRKSGWLIRGPGGLFMYVKEEDFNAFFEIVQEK